MSKILDELNSNLAVKKNFTIRSRQIELASRSNVIRTMYHNVLESVRNLYKDDRNNNYTWQTFRNTADMLAEMHKYIKVTVVKAHELGSVEGASAFSTDFFQKVKDLQLENGSQNIPFDYFRQYLSRSDDPPPRYLRRVKRLASRRLRRRPVSNDLLRDVILSNSTNSKPNQLSSSSQNNSITVLNDSTWSHDSHLCEYKTSGSKWNVIQENAEMDCLSEDCGSSLSSKCTCDSESTDVNAVSSDDDYDLSSDHDNKSIVVKDTTSLINVPKPNDCIYSD